MDARRHWGRLLFHEARGRRYTGRGGRERRLVRLWDWGSGHRRSPDGLIAVGGDLFDETGATLIPAVFAERSPQNWERIGGLGGSRTRTVGLVGYENGVSFGVLSDSSLAIDHVYRYSGEKAAQLT